jgi:hypothetical protein
MASEMTLRILRGRLRGRSEGSSEGSVLTFYTRAFDAPLCQRQGSPFHVRQQRLERLLKLCLIWDVARKREESLTWCVRDCEKGFGRELLRRRVVCVVCQFGQVGEGGQGVSVKQAKALHGKLSEPLWPGSRQPPQKTSRVVRQREQVKGAPVNYFGTAGFMADPCQKIWKRVGADRSNRILRLVDLLSSCVLAARAALLEVFEVTIYPAIRDDVQPLRKRASLINRLVVALSWWRRKQNYGAGNQEPGRDPDQGLSALPHGWEDSMTAKEAKDAVVKAFAQLIKGRSENCDIRALSLSRLLSKSSCPTSFIFSR